MVIDLIGQRPISTQGDSQNAMISGSFFLAGTYETFAGPEEELKIPDLDAQRESVVVGVSGEICAGKTTAARAIERLSFAYTRFSLVIDDEIPWCDRSRQIATVEITFAQPSPAALHAP